MKQSQLYTEQRIAPARVIHNLSSSMKDVLSPIRITTLKILVVQINSLCWSFRGTVDERGFVMAKRQLYTTQSKLHKRSRVSINRGTIRGRLH